MLTLNEVLDNEESGTERISQSKPTKSSAQLYDEIITREKIRRWKDKYSPLGYLLEKYYTWRKKI